MAKLNIFQEEKTRWNLRLSKIDGKWLPWKTIVVQNFDYGYVNFYFFEDG